MIPNEDDFQIGNYDSDLKPKNKNTPSKEDVNKLLKECRDMLLMCVIIDNSGLCLELVDKVDNVMNWK